MFGLVFHKTTWNLIGFRFGPFLIVSLGMLGDRGTDFSFRSFEIGKPVESVYK